MKKLMLLLTICLIGCAEVPQKGTQIRTVILSIVDKCDVPGGFTKIKNNTVYICIEQNKYEWVWQDEANHLFRELTGLPQPESHWF